MAFLFQKISQFRNQRKKRANALRELAKEQNNADAWKAEKYWYLDENRIPNPARDCYARLAKLTEIPFKEIIPWQDSPYKVNPFANATYYGSIHSFSYIHTSNKFFNRDIVQHELLHGLQGLLGNLPKSIFPLPNPIPTQKNFHTYRSEISASAFGSRKFLIKDQLNWGVGKLFGYLIGVNITALPSLHLTNNRFAPLALMGLGSIGLAGWYRAEANAFKRLYAKHGVDGILALFASKNKHGIMISPLLATTRLEKMGMLKKTGGLTKQAEELIRTKVLENLNEIENNRKTR